MPTYTYACMQCGSKFDAVMSIGAYTATKPRPQCCGADMQRVIEHAPAMMVSDAHYAGLRAPDGTDISTRAKHRAYMREHNLTTMDDFTETWKRNEREREQRMAGVDPTRKDDIVRAIHKLGG